MSDEVLDKTPTALGESAAPDDGDPATDADDLELEAALERCFAATGPRPVAPARPPTASLPAAAPRHPLAAVLGRIDDIADALSAALRQDLAVHQQVLTAAARAVGDLAAPLDTLAETDADTARTVLRRARSELDALFGERLLRRFERYHQQDAAVIALEHTIERLETFPDTLERRLELTDGPRRRLVPLRASVELALAHSRLLDLNRGFARILAGRDRLRAALLELHEHVIDELDLAIGADDLTAAAAPNAATDAVLTSRVTHLVARAVGERRHDERPVLDRARAALAEVQHALSGMANPQIQTTRELLAACDELCTTLREAALDALERTSAPARATLAVRRFGATRLMRSRRWLAHVRGADVARQQQRVRYHPKLRAFLRDLESRIASFVRPLDAGATADLAHHQATFEVLREALELARERLEHACDKADSEPHAATLRQLRRSAQRQLKRIYQALERRVLGPLARYYASDPLLALVEQAAASATSLADAIEPRLDLGYEHQTRAQPSRQPKGRVVIVRTGDIVEQRLAERDVAGLTAHADALRQLRTTLERRLHEVWNIVRYNLEGAIAEADEALAALAAGEAPGEAPLDKCRDMALGGMRRAATRLDAIGQELEAFHQRVTADFADRLAITAGVTRDAASAATFRGNVRFWRTELRVETRRAWQQLSHWLRSTARRTARWLTERARATARSRLLRELLGLTADEEATAEAVDENPALEAPPELRLPPVYRRLFALEPLQLEEFLVGRDEALAQLERAHRVWLEGERRSVLIYGDPGSGKRSFLNCGLDRLGEGLPVVRIGLEERPGSAHELVTRICAQIAPEADLPAHDPALALEAMPGRRIVVLERLHLAFVRRAGGFEAIRAILALIGRTDHKLLWIVSLEAHPFAVLQRLLRLSDAFSHVIPMKGLEPAALEKAVLARHELSGYRLRFVADDATRERLGRELRRARGDTAAEQTILRKQFYRTLHEASGGNLHSAIVYWLRAVSRAPDDTELLVSMLDPVEPPGLERFANDHLFALAAILVHGELEPEELAEVLDLDPARTRTILQFLAHRGFVQPVAATAPTSSDDAAPPAAASEYRHRRVRLAQPMLKPVVRALTSRNIVHWPTP